MKFYVFILTFLVLISCKTLNNDSNSNPVEANEDTPPKPIMLYPETNVVEQFPSNIPDHMKRTINITTDWIFGISFGSSQLLQSVIKEDFDLHFEEDQTFFGEHSMYMNKDNTEEWKQSDFEYFEQVEKNLLKCAKNEPYEKINTSSINDIDTYILVSMLFANECSKSSGKSVIEVLDTNSIENFVLKELEESQNNFEKDKNNMEKSYTTIRNFNLIKKQIEELKKFNIQLTNDAHKDVFLDSINLEIERVSDKITDYSYNYEKEIYEKWSKKNKIRNIKDTSPITPFVYRSDMQPTKGLFKYYGNLIFKLKVIQSIPGGVILSGIPQVGIDLFSAIPNYIFLQTSDEYADNQIIYDNFIAEYSGFFEYTTIMGARKKIYKFTQISKTEIEKILKGPDIKFYFFKP